MRKIVLYETLDGKRFDTSENASRYLTKLYGDTLEKITHKIIKETDGKYEKLIHWIDANHTLFAFLQDVSNDLVCEGDTEGDI